MLTVFLLVLFASSLAGVHRGAHQSALIENELGVKQVGVVQYGTSANPPPGSGLPPPPGSLPGTTLGGGGAIPVTVVNEWKFLQTGLSVDQGVVDTQTIQGVPQATWELIPAIHGSCIHYGDPVYFRRPEGFLEALNTPSDANTKARACVYPGLTIQLNSSATQSTQWKILPLNSAAVPGYSPPSDQDCVWSPYPQVFIVNVELNCYLSVCGLSTVTGVRGLTVFCYSGGELINSANDAVSRWNIISSRGNL